MLQRPPRVAAIHDLSGFGRCSLSVILPVLSVMGVQAVPVPTAVLSTHTGGMGPVEFRDLTDYTIPSLEHYQRLHLEFECVYSGFLSSEQQIDHCLAFQRAFPNALVVVDPVMGDNGKSYATYTPAMRSRMAELVAGADLITPNMTETCMLLKIPHIHEPIPRAQVKSLLVRLSEMGPKTVIITSVPMSFGAMANVGYDREKNTFWMVECDYVPVSYPGTGDLFAAVVTGALLGGDSLPIAMARATGYLEKTIKTTYSYGSDTRYGVMFEKTLPCLAQPYDFKSYQNL